MKVFCFLFIVQVLVLLSQPCDELFPDPDESGTKQATVRIDNNSNEPTRDECSPFCTCSCCSHPVANQALVAAVTQDIKHSVIKGRYTTYTNPFTKTYTGFVWQPPKA